jgi:hypothetical protein
MQRVLVLDTNRQPLMPCHPARARQLVTAGKAAVYRRYPFTDVYPFGREARQLSRREERPCLSGFRPMLVHAAHMCYTSIYETDCTTEAATDAGTS